MAIEALFLDVGGVLGSNGWGRNHRQAAAEKFGFDLAEMEERHRMTFDSYEIGKLTLREYVQRTLFNRPRDFSPEQFIEFMYSCSQPYPEVIELFCNVRRQHGVKVVIVSNEGRELTRHRINQFGLRGLADAFVFSCFVGYRKPDPDIFQLALDVAQVPPDNILYVDDRELFVEVARSYGMHGHVQNRSDLESTRLRLAELGLSTQETVAAPTLR